MTEIKKCVNCDDEDIDEYKLFSLNGGWKEHVPLCKECRSKFMHGEIEI